MKLAEKIGLNIKKARVAKKMSQEQVAYLARMHQSQIYRFERGKQPINISHLEKISEVLDVPVIEFFKTDFEIHQNFDNQELLETIYQMPQDKKKELLEILKNLKDYDFGSLRKAVELVKDIKGG